MEGGWEACHAVTNVFPPWADQTHSRWVLGREGVLLVFLLPGGLGVLLPCPCHPNPTLITSHWGEQHPTQTPWWGQGQIGRTLSMTHGLPPHFPFNQPSAIDRTAPPEENTVVLYFLGLQYDSSVCLMTVSWLWLPQGVSVRATHISREGSVVTTKLDVTFHLCWVLSVCVSYSVQPDRIQKLATLLSSTPSPYCLHPIPVL